MSIPMSIGSLSIGSLSRSPYEIVIPTSGVANAMSGHRFAVGNDLSGGGTARESAMVCRYHA